MSATPSGDEMLARRQSTHGDFADTADTAQAIKDALRLGRTWKRLSPARKEALDGLAVKMARAANGNGAFADHWDDMGGWARAGRTGAPRE